MGGHVYLASLRMLLVVTMMCIDCSTFYNKSYPLGYFFSRTEFRRSFVVSIIFEQFPPATKHAF